MSLTPSYLADLATRRHDRILAAWTSSSAHGVDAVWHRASLGVLIRGGNHVVVELSDVVETRIIQNCKDLAKSRSSFEK